MTHKKQMIDDRKWYIKEKEIWDLHGIIQTEKIWYSPKLIIWEIFSKPTKNVLGAGKFNGTCLFFHSFSTQTTDTRRLNLKFFAAQIQIPLTNKYLGVGYKGLVLMIEKWKTWKRNSLYKNGCWWSSGQKYPKCLKKKI